ncbi:hypothetical protein SKAU_G00135180 [Synaphobranchus kaupii]|uniref:Uncharacterized protein n=1 Tax=Synaphobranchus kaupii TaxID=118154 RepID=A0A9Q1FRA9_SYNKA|nr:hypothetical protein SKAU_G00135180 [Synaphobranchus kaupii]
MSDPDIQEELQALRARVEADKILYCSGRQNAGADALSRQYTEDKPLESQVVQTFLETRGALSIPHQGACCEETSAATCTEKVSAFSFPSYSKESLAALQEADPVISSFLKYWARGQRPSREERAKESSRMVELVDSQKPVHSVAPVDSSKPPRNVYRAELRLCGPGVKVSEHNEDAPSSMPTCPAESSSEEEELGSVVCIRRPSRRSRAPSLEEGCSEERASSLLEQEERSEEEGDLDEGERGDCSKAELVLISLCQNEESSPMQARGGLRSVAWAGEPELGHFLFNLTGRTPGTTGEEKEAWADAKFGP